jgi:L-histidine N-alpha-methyltransferase
VRVLAVAFADGEELRTEISAKFHRERFAQELAEAGRRLERWETDASGDYALSLARPA